MTGQESTVARGNVDLRHAETRSVRAIVPKADFDGNRFPAEIRRAMSGRKLFA
jgi:hypothetical protein